MPRTLVVIPARYASTRFPGKPLALLGGKPILQWVWDALSGRGNWDTIIATDDDRIACAAKVQFQANVMLTSVNCQSGTDRCGEVLQRIHDEKQDNYDLVVNVQGDEPLVDPNQIEALVKTFADPEVQIATLCTPITSTDELLSPNNVKVARGDKGQALYFSRWPIPYRREAEPEQWLTQGQYQKHVGIYAFRAKVLKAICTLPVSPLEEAERLEQLRWLAAGYTIRVVETDHANIGIDTPDDLLAANNIITQKRQK
ncbi:MAG: 3-deoxy-manno-octulosonate cytidylyltransferase [Bacteroidales bacterium]|nr:3-deoxy-manno-octulosonate cytidylyltransferase [Bacteroidales bacterium]